MTWNSAPRLPFGMHIEMLTMQGRLAMEHDLSRVKVAAPIRKAIAEHILDKVHARMAADNLDRSDSARVELVLQEEVARFNAETSSDFRVVLHHGTDRQDGFAVVIEVVPKGQVNN
jgi:hypothetical protein